jgi:type II secretory pathway component PulK
MLMIWAIMLMAFTVAGVVSYMNDSLKERSDEANQFRAHYMAECGLGIAMYPQVYAFDAIKNADGVLVGYKRGSEQKPPGDAGFSLYKLREGSRIPINFLTGEQAREVVYNLFVLWGVNSTDAATAADSLADWQDRDSDARPQGAEADYYKGLGIYNLPRNRGFSSLEEMLLVRGFNKIALIKPNWRDYFSLYGEGTIDLFWASKDVIMALTGASDADATRLITARAGQDGVDGTDDDDRTIGVPGAIKMLGVAPDKIASVTNLVSYATDKIFRVVSKGFVGTHTVTITLIAKMQDDGSLTYLSRLED